MGIFGEEESTLQTGVYGLDGGLDAVKLLVGVACDLHDGRLEVGLPSGIAFAVLYACACQEEVGFDLGCDVVLA